MLKYTGSADFEKVNMRMFGDGVTKDVTIDLSKPPFNISFKGFFPKNVAIANIAPGIPKMVTISGDSLMIIFQDPPPEVDFDDLVLTEPPENRVAFTLYFVYGTGVA